MTRLDNIKYRARKVFAFLLSIVSTKPVFYGRGFSTVSDDGWRSVESKLLSDIKEKNNIAEEQVARKKGVIQYCMNSDARFELVGFYDLHGKTVVRISDKSTGIERNIDLSFFNTYFKSI